ncbi:MAG: hypothetical protein KAH84_09780 [Thiomargarita sp.]|nr:hypothetical protein [Thiomargarita sp.]
MSIAEIVPLIESLSHSDKFQLMQSLLTQLAKEEGLSLQMQPNSNQGQSMANILQRMADRQALFHISDPVTWQREIRKEHPLLGRK